MNKQAINNAARSTYALAVLFIGLKLTGYIGWSWVWVLCPLWAPPAVYVLGLPLIVLGAWMDGTAKGRRQ